MAMIGESGFLKNHEGRPSLMRLTSFVAFAAAVAFGFIAVRSPDVGDLYPFVSALIAAFAPKTLWKFMEADEALRRFAVEKVAEEQKPQ